MKKELKNSLLSMLLIILLLASLLSNITLSSQVHILNSNLKNKDLSLNDLKTQNTQLQQMIDLANSECDFWRDSYLNYKQKTIYSNTTSYIYINTTEFKNNSICDVDRNSIVDYQDAFLVYSYIQNGLSFIETVFYNNHPNPYERLYDVNRDHSINENDVNFIWENCD
jgi:hypothetical protein